MSNALAKINSEVASRTQPVVTDAEAEIAAKECGMSERDVASLKLLVGSKKLGDFIQDKIHGAIAMQAFMDRNVLDEVQQIMMDVLKFDPKGQTISPEVAVAISGSKIDAANVVANIISKKNEIHAIQLKVKEIGGYSKPKKESKPVGPPRNTPIDVPSS